MKLVLQKVKSASVVVEQKTVGEIQHGFLILLGIALADTTKQADWLAEKVLKLRLFGREDSESFMDQDVREVHGGLLVVSQFTLYGDCKKGTKPSFTSAARPEQAKELYEYFVARLRESGLKVETGIFGAEMEVGLVNDGPVTLVVDSN